MTDNQKEHDWYGATLETPGTQMVDSGTGKPYILRTFEFAINPKVAKEMRDKKQTMDKQQLFNSHWPQIRLMLMSDGLVANEDVPPRVVVGKKRGKGKYRIFVLCEPKAGVAVVDKVATLQDLFKKF